MVPSISEKAVVGSQSRGVHGPVQAEVGMHPGILAVSGLAMELKSVVRGREVAHRKPECAVRA